MKLQISSAGVFYRTHSNQPRSVNFSNKLKLREILHAARSMQWQYRAGLSSSYFLDREGASRGEIWRVLLCFDTVSAFRYNQGRKRDRAGAWRINLRTAQAHREEPPMN